METNEVPQADAEKLARMWLGMHYADGHTADEIESLCWAILGHPDEETKAAFRTLTALAPLPQPEGMGKEALQARVDPWLLACFGETIARDKVERNHRFLEESLEVVQAAGCTESEAHQLVSYVFGRPIGELTQEVGGAMITLAALCLANGVDMHEAGEVELARIWTKVEKIRAKQAAKPKHSPLPAHPSTPENSNPLREALQAVLLDIRTSTNGLRYETIEKVLAALSGAGHPVNSPGSAPADTFVAMRGGVSTVCAPVKP